MRHKKQNTSFSILKFSIEPMQHAPFVTTQYLVSPICFHPPESPWGAGCSPAGACDPDLASFSAVQSRLLPHRGHCWGRGPRLILLQIPHRNFFGTFHPLSMKKNCELIKCFHMKLAESLGFLFTLFI